MTSPCCPRDAEPAAASTAAGAAPGHSRRADVRRLLGEVFRSDAAFDAFCLDYYPDVKAQFSDAMNRTCKMNLLLESCESAAILAAVERAQQSAPPGWALPLRRLTAQHWLRRPWGYLLVLCLFGAAWGYRPPAASRTAAGPEPASAASIQMLRRGCYAKDHSACKQMLDSLVAACRASPRAACNDLGVLYEQGIGSAPNPAAASLSYKAGCDSQDARACVNLGLLYDRGVGVLQDDRLAFVLYQRGCELDPAQCNHLGTLYSEGRGVARDIKRAFSIYESACRAGSSQACLNYALKICLSGLAADKIDEGRAILDKHCSEYDSPSACYALGLFHFRRDPADKAAVGSYYQRACDLKYGDACLTLGWHLQRYGLFAQAFSAFQKGCEVHHQPSCVEVGAAYERGLGVEPSPARALQTYQAGCEKADQNSCVQIGKLFRSGRGVPRSLGKAVSVFTTACSHGEPSGCTELARCYLTGEGVPLDKARALAMFQESCEKEDDEGCMAAAHEYATPTSQGYDLEQAATLYRRACQMDNPVGCRHAGSLYQQDGLTSRNPELARQLLTKACRLQDHAACGLLSSPAR